VIHVPSRSRVFPGFSRRFPELADFSKIFPETTQPRLLPTTLVSLWVYSPLDFERWQEFEVISGGDGLRALHGVVSFHWHSVN